MRKKIAFFTFGGLGTGNFSQGLPTLTQLVNALAKDFDITIYSLETFSEGYTPSGFRAYCVPHWISFQKLRWIYLIVVFSLHCIHTKYKTLYSFWGYPTGKVVVRLGKLFKVPSVVNILGGETANLPEIDYGLLRNDRTRKAVLWTCTHASQLITLTEYQKNILRTNGIQRQIRVIPWGADKKRFYPAVKRLELPLKILHVGNLNAVKDQETLIRAFGIIRNQMPAILQIVGSGILAEKLQSLVKQLNLEKDIHFVGAVPHANLLPYFHWADAFILTSLSEGQNNSITEAMMCGLLPVSTSVGIMSDIGDQVGIKTTIKEYEALGNKVLALYQLPGEWEGRRNAALSWASQHDLDWTVQQLGGVLNDI